MDLVFLAAMALLWLAMVLVVRGLDALRQPAADTQLRVGPAAAEASAQSAGVKP